jgi:hypothetical protein
MPGLRRFVLVAILATAVPGLQAQWLKYPTPGTPRTKDGKPDLNAPAPRAADGKPDLSGVWMHQPTPLAEWKRLLGDDRVDNAGKVLVPGMELDTNFKYAFNILLDLKPEVERPAAADIRRRRNPSSFPSNNCLPLGIPLDVLVDAPSKIVQSAGLIVILLEVDGTHRQIYTDGRELPKEVAQPSWLGYSVGKWEGDTLVMETAGFNDKTWLDAIGHPHSEALRLVERYRRRDFGHMDVEMTFDDPQMYTKPFTITFTNELLASSDVFEYVCNENEKDRAHIGQNRADTPVAPRTTRRTSAPPQTAGQAPVQSSTTVLRTLSPVTTASSATNARTA